MTQRDDSRLFSFFRWIAETSETHSGRYLAAIVLLAALLRIPALGTVPQGFHFDEAVVGYDAYCILHTGADHYGDRLPVLARTFNGYNEALNRYITAVSISILGLNVAAVRLPFALSGVLSILVIYFFALELYRNKQIALFVAFTLAVSPWHIHYTRTTFAAMLLPMLVALGSASVLKARKDSKYLAIAGIAFGLSLFTYMSARGFVPLFVFGLLIVYWSDLRRYHRQIAIGAVIFISALFFISSFWFSSLETGRWGQTKTGSLAAWGFGYWNSYSPILFFRLPNEYSQIFDLVSPGLSLLHSYELIVIPIGVVYIIRTWQHEYWLLLIWLILYPFPAFMTMGGSEHVLRLSNGVIITASLSGYGLWRVFVWLQNRSSKRGIVVFTACIVVILLTNCNIYVNKRNDYNATLSKWQYGFERAISVSSGLSHHKIFISANVTGAYILTLFFSKHLPNAAQVVMQSVALPEAGLIHNIPNISFGRYNIRPAELLFEESLSEKGNVIIATLEDINDMAVDQFETIERIDYPNGEPALYVLKSKGGREEVPQNSRVRDDI